MVAELRAVAREAGAVYRAFAGPILLFAVLVFSPASLLEKEALHGLEEGLGGVALHAQIATILSWAAGTAGYWFFSALLTEMVPARRAAERPRVRELVRGTPYLKLIALDLLIAAAVSVGLALFIVPGLLLAIRLAIAPQVLELRHERVWRSLSISLALTRRRMLLVGTVVGLTVGAEEAFSGLLEAATRSLADTHVLGVPLDSVCSLLAAAVLIKPLGALCLVVLAVRLGGAAPETQR